MPSRREREAVAAARRRRSLAVWIGLGVVAVLTVLGAVAVATGNDPPYRGPRDCVRVDLDEPLVCDPPIGE